MRFLSILMLVLLLGGCGDGDDNSESVTIFNDAFNLACDDQSELIGDAALEIQAEARIARAAGLRSLRVECNQVNEPVVGGANVDIDAILAGELDDEDIDQLTEFIATGKHIATDSDELL